MPFFDQSGLRHVVFLVSNISTPSLMALMIMSFDSLNALSRIGDQKNLA